MNLIDVIEPQTKLGMDTNVDAVAIPLEPWFRHEPDTWQVPRARRARRVKRPPKSQTASINCRYSYLIAKRCIDILSSLLAIILLSPVMLVAALIVKLTDGGPVLYIHERVGLGGKKFMCLKFRSMTVDAEVRRADLEAWNSHEDSRTFKIPNDPRVTWFGRIMRRSSMDELPQLFNVLIGDMSLVGPRPPVPREVAQYTPHDMQRLDVKPGLTCLWQISGRSHLPFPEQLRLDLKYVEQRCLWLDLKVLLLTIPAVLSADGAY
jgi:exopolysaccharide biosynthesis polyprenyl glycosylphosphotransferase